MSERPLPLACQLPEAALQRRGSEIRAGLARRVIASQELSDGIAFRLPLTDASVAEAEAFVAFERNCCGFADFSLRHDEADAALWIEIRGPVGTKAFFRQMMPSEIIDPDPPCPP